jgi:hypothetical protein
LATGIVHRGGLKLQNIENGEHVVVIDCYEKSGSGKSVVTGVQRQKKFDPCGPETSFYLEAFG